MKNVTLKKTNIVYIYFFSDLINFFVVVENYLKIYI